ncbi:hypothetical protein FOZ61_000629, partial [Perkinsus olseni]
DRPHCAGIISFNILYNENKTGHHHHGLYLHYNFVGCVLNDVFGIQARGGCACGTRRVLDRTTAFSTRDMIFKPGFVRVGVHFTMTQEELEYLADAILWIAEKGWKLMAAYNFKLSSGEWKHAHRDEANIMKNMVISLSPAMLRLPEGEHFWMADSPKVQTDPVSRNLLSALATPREKQCASPAALTKPRDDPLIPAQLSSVLWFALPVDTIWSLKRAGRVERSQPEVCTDLNVPIFAKSSAQTGRISRKTESVLNARTWSDRAPPPVVPPPPPQVRPSIPRMLKMMIGQKVACHAEKNQ